MTMTPDQMIDMLKWTAVNAKQHYNSAVLAYESATDEDTSRLYIAKLDAKRVWDAAEAAVTTARTFFPMMLNTSTLNCIDCGVELTEGQVADEDSLCPSCINSYNEGGSS